MSSITSFFHINKERNVAYWVYIAVVVTFIAVHWVMFALFPTMSDDYWFSCNFIDRVHDAGQGFPWQQMMDNLYWHLLYDNLRLSNVTLVFLLVIPKWIGALIPALCTGFILTGVCRYASITCRNMMWVAIAIAAISVWLPWLDSIFVLCYAMNYVVPAAMSIWFVNALIKGTRITPGLIVIGLLLGAWNEAFSFPIFGGAFVLALFSRGTRRRHIVKVTALLLPGIIYILITQTIHFLNSNIYELDNPNIVTGIVRSCKQVFPIFIFIGILSVRIIATRSFRLLSPTIIFVLVSAIVNIAMYVIFQRGPRMVFYANLILIAAIIEQCRTFAGPKWNGNTPRSIIVAVIIGVWMTAHYSAATYRTVVFRHEWLAIEQTVRKSQPGPLFVNISRNKVLEVISNNKPILFTYYPWMNNTLDMAFPGNGGSWLILPKQLQHVRPETGTPVAGTLNARMVDNYYCFVPDHGQKLSNEVYVQSGPIGKSLFVTPLHFESTDGNYYYFIPLNLISFPWNVFPIERIDLYQ